MIFKVVTLSTALVIGMLYVTGFVVDSVYLEVFGISYSEILGSPLDYLAIGGAYALRKYSYWSVTIAFFLPFLVAFGIDGLQKYKDDPTKYTSIKRYINSKSAPYLLASPLPIFLVILIYVVIPESKSYALTDLEKSKKEYDQIRIIGEDECIAGTILRYRGGKVFFYNHATEKTSIYNDSLLAEAIHYVRKPEKD